MRDFYETLARDRLVRAQDFLDEARAASETRPHHEAATFALSALADCFDCLAQAEQAATRVDDPA